MPFVQTESICGHHSYKNAGPDLYRLLKYTFFPAEKQIYEE